MRRQRLTFRLRTLLAITCVVAIAAAAYAKYVWRQPDFRLMHLGGSLSMAPTLTNEYFVADFNAYRHRKPERWHAVVLDPKQTMYGSYTAEVLRIIGLPGETVSFEDKRILIDGVPLQLSATLLAQQNHFVRHSEYIPHPYTIPEGCYYLLGDNLDHARDSRLHGAFPLSDIKGRVSGR